MKFTVKRSSEIRKTLLRHAYDQSLKRCAESNDSFCIKHSCTPKFQVARTPYAQDLPLPRRQTPGASGLDLHANVHTDICIKKGTRALIPTGIKLAMPIGFEAQVRPRSGLAFRFGVTVLNTPGTVDSDYRGEVCVLLINHGEEDFIVRRGDRIAQLVIARVEMCGLKEVDELPDSARGESGYGSTGVGK